MSTGLTQQEKQEILELIYQECTHPGKLRPREIVRETESFFFSAHNNTFEGYFIDVRGGLSDYDWHIQRIR